MTPAFNHPRIICKIPANTTDVRNISKAPRSEIAFSTITVKPAAGPDTAVWEPEREPITIPPTTPAIIPENKGAPEDNAIPKHRGSATKKTTNPEGKSLPKWEKILFLISIYVYFWVFENVLANYKVIHLIYTFDKDNLYTKLSLSKVPPLHFSKKTKRGKFISEIIR
jgi:hypothetical protein